jgi:putative aldouronate transport system permease protein
MILVRNYIQGMPREVFEFSKIEGANDLVIFFKVVLPLCKPIIMTIALFVAIMHWNSWFDAYLFTNSQSLKVMQSILVEILNQYQTAAANQVANRAGMSITPDSIRMAATMVATIPIIMFYPFIQKYFVKGIMLGAVKS